MAIINKNRLIEKYMQVVRLDGLNTNKNVNIGIAAGGSTATLSVGSGGINTTGSITGGVLVPVVQSALVGATVALTVAQSGGVFQNRSTSGTPSWTLPTNSNGLEFTFTTANTTTGFTVTGGTIKAKTSATGTAITGTTLTNTQDTAVVGDAITLVADGTAWWVTAQTGIFAAA
jgi:hypothetical protein